MYVCVCRVYYSCSTINLGMFLGLKLQDLQIISRFMAIVLLTLKAIADSSDSNISWLLFYASGAHAQRSIW